MNKPTPPVRLFKNAEWHACYTQWIASVASPVSRAHYRLLMQRLFAFVEVRTGSKKTPDKVTRQDIEAFLRVPSQRGQHKGGEIAHASRNGYLMILMSFYNWCATYMVEFRGKWLPILRSGKPTDGIKIVKQEKADRDMEEDDAAAFFAAIDVTTITGLRDDALFQALIVTGRRRAEIASLVCGDFEQVTLLEHGRTRAGWIYHFQGKGHLSKDDSGEMPQPIMDAIVRYHQAAGRDFATLPATYPVFTGGSRNLATCHPLNVGVVDYRFRHYAKKAGLSQNICVHSLRREHAWRRYQENGHDILDVRDALRHSDVKTTMIYIDRRRKKHQGDSIATALASKYGRC